MKRPRYQHKMEQIAPIDAPMLETDSPKDDTEQVHPVESVDIQAMIYRVAKVLPNGHLVIMPTEQS
jgi:hypothetical protein